MLAADLAGKASEHMPDWWRRIDEDPAWRSYSECVCSEACITCDAAQLLWLTNAPSCQVLGTSKAFTRRTLCLLHWTDAATVFFQGRLAYTDVAITGVAVKACTLWHAINSTFYAFTNCQHITDLKVSDEDFYLFLQVWAGCGLRCNCSGGSGAAGSHSDAGAGVWLDHAEGVPSAELPGRLAAAGCVRLLGQGEIAVPILAASSLLHQLPTSAL